MTSMTIRALVKGLEKKVREDGDLTEVLESIEKISVALGEAENEEPRIRVPYVNASPISTGTWK